MTEHAEPVGGRLFTRPIKALAILAGIAAVLVLIRLIFGIGAVTNLSDGYPWGLWIAFDVVTGTALACGGYAVALLVYIRNKGQYHPLVRPAILTSALGYSLAGFGVLLDVGRWWSVWRVPLFFWEWNLSSVLLEVALCIMAYVVVLWIELSPAFFERGRYASSPRVRAISERGLKIVNRALIWIVALGILLPTMHQSSLGSLMLLAGPRLHPLWNTGWLPLLFLISCIAMGYAVVVFEAALSSAFLRRKPEIEMLAGIGRVMAPIALLYPALRIADLAFAGRLPLLFAFDAFSGMALLELVLAVIPGVMLLNRGKRQQLGYLFRAAVLMMLAGSLYRFDTYLLAFRPGDNWSYFPSVPEMFTTFGLIAAEILAYLLIIKFFPILTGAAVGTGKAGTAWART
ncbi:MAG TPA: Ni/Fe-hydrogenase cytochrome b subunit [Vicinamibacterales bacterium]|nr:Ni/Fe-hydrogenase cytochrome b subunit [Vicinamibacterales bacterium]